MKLSDLLQLDLRIKGNEQTLREALLRLPFFSDKEDLLVSDLEQALHKMERKYPVRLGYIMSGPLEENYYSFMLKRTDSNEHIKTIYGLTMFEGFSKVILYLFGYIKNTFKKEQT